MSSPRPLVIAHRGRVAGSGAPDNSLEAVAAAIGSGADMIEVDVRRTRDGELIAFHDARIADRRVSALSRAEIARQLGHEPPLLAEIVDLARGRIGLDVELKEAGYVAEALAPLGAGDPGERLLVSSFIDAVLSEAKALRSEIETGLLVGGRDPWRCLHRRELFPVGRAQACGARYLLPHLNLLRLGVVGRASRARLPCIPWTVNDGGLLERLAGDPRIAGVITDLPAQALALHDGR